MVLTSKNLENLKLWWLSEKRLPKEKDMTLQSPDGIDHTVNTPIQLYNILKKISKLIKDA